MAFRRLGLIGFELALFFCPASGIKFDNPLYNRYLRSFYFLEIGFVLHKSRWFVEDSRSPAEKQVSIHRGQALGEKLDKIWGSVTMRETPDLLHYKTADLRYLRFRIHESGLAGSKSLPLGGLRHANWNVIFACWRFMFACWLTYGYFNVFSNIVNKKMYKKATFFNIGLIRRWLYCR